jgi:hypothetical protein
MEIVPMAMLWHLGIASDENDFSHCPVILPDQADFTYAFSLFGQSIEEVDDKQPSPFLHCNAILNHGMLSFCEATKVDLQSWYNSKKNWIKPHDTSILSTSSLLWSLLVDVMNVDVAIQSRFQCPCQK